MWARWVSTVVGLMFSRFAFYRTQRIGQAQAFRKAGNRLLAQARFDEAVAQYRSALSISHSVDDRLALALALMKADAASEASLYLNEVLQSRPRSGPANLALARIESQQGQVVDAISRFQRAADGSWTERPEENRVEARMDLVETLARAGRSAHAKAELLSLITQLPNDPVIQERVGQILTDFGLLRESVDFFQDIAQRHPQDAAAHQKREKRSSGWGTMPRHSKRFGGSCCFILRIRLRPSGSKRAKES